MDKKGKSGPVVWIIDRQHWPRACLCAELIERGYDAVGFEEIPQAVASILHKGTANPRVIVLELREQRLNRIELDNLGHHKIPIIALSGRLELQDELAAEFPWAAIIRRPFTIGAVCDAVEKEIHRGDAENAEKK